MKSEGRTMNSDNIHTRPPGPVDVNVAMGIREWGLILILSGVSYAKWKSGDEDDEEEEEEEEEEED